MRKILPFFIFLITLPGWPSAQNAPPLRLEFETEAGQQPYSLITLGKSGLLLVYKAKSDISDTHNWMLYLYDLNFKNQWSRSLPLPSGYELSRYDRSDSAILLLFTNDSRKNTRNQLSLVNIKIRDGSLASVPKILPERSESTDCMLYGHHILIFGLAGEEKCFLLMTDLKGEQDKRWDPATDNPCFMHGVVPGNKPGRFSVVYEEFTAKKKSEFHIQHLQQDLSPAGRVTIDPGPDMKSIIHLRMHQAEDGTYLVIGTYSSNPEKTAEQSLKNTGEATGFISCLLRDTLLISKNYYNFLEFKNFFNRLRGSQAILDSRSLKNDKEQSSDYRLLLHDIVMKNKERIILAEAYYPEYHTVTNWIYDYYGHMIPTHQTVFDGYRYNNAFTAGFDSTGQMKWENSIEINSVLTFDLARRAVMLFDGDFAILAYNQSGKIASKVINRNETVEGITYDDIALSDTRDRVISDNDSYMSYWYENYLICYGYQEIKNLSRANSRRNIFYINKIAFR